MTRRGPRDGVKRGATTSREEARANRKMQLVVVNTFPGGRGKTLLEKMEDVVDRTREERAVKGESSPSDSEEPEAYNEWLDWMLKNEGQIQGMLKMLAIMRSTTMKDELQRSKDRIKFNA